MKTSKLLPWVLVIGLFAFIFWGSSQSRRGSGGPIPMSDRDYATQTIEYSIFIKKTVSQMIRNGVKVDDLDFTLPDEPGYTPSSSEVFKKPFSEQDDYSPSVLLFPGIFDGQRHFVFTGANKIPGIGTDTPEIIFITWPIKKRVCEKIDDRLQLHENWVESHILGKNWLESHILSNPPDVTPFHPDQKRQTVTELNTPEEVCVQDKNGIRYYIHTIVER